MTVLKGQVPKEREKSSKPQHTKTQAVLRLEEDKRLMGNFYCPDGSGLQSLTQTNQQHSWDFFFFFLKQRFVGKAEAFTMHRAQQEQPAVLPAMLGRTNQLKPVATKEQNQTRRKRLLQRSCPLTKQSRGGGEQQNPTAQQLLHPTPRFQHRHVKELQLLVCMSDLYQTTTAAHLRGQAGGGKGMLRDPRAPPVKH